MTDSSARCADLVRGTRRCGAGLLAALVALSGCVDVPDPAQPTADARPGGDDGPPMPDGALRDADREGPPTDATPDDRDAEADARTTDMLPDVQFTDMQLPDMHPPADMQPTDMQPTDMQPDMQVADPYADCLLPVSGVRPADAPCLRVRPVPGPAEHFVSATATTLAPGTPDQRVVVIGGLERLLPGADGLTTVRIYDPLTDTWLADGPPLPTGRWGHGAVRLTTDEVLVAGGAAGLGADGFWEGSATVYRWQPGERAWILADEGLAPGRSDGALTAVPGVGAVYVGGRTNRNALPRTEVDVAFDGGGVAASDAQLAVARTGPMAAALSDGSLLVVGGLGNNGDAVTPSQRLGGAGVTSLPLPGNPAPRAFGGAAALPDGAVFFGGVARADGPPTTSAVRYASRYNRFVEAAPLIVPRARPTVSAIGPEGHGWRLVVGGEAADGPPGQVELYDPSTDSTTAYILPAPVRRRRALHAAAAFRVDDDWQVLVAGGYDPAGEPGEAATYDDQALRFELELPPTIVAPLPAGCLAPVDENAAGPCLRVWRGPALSAPRTQIGAVAVREGPVVVGGGFDFRADQLFDTVESWLPGTRAWSPEPSLIVPRAGHWMLALDDDAEPFLAALAGIGFWEGDAFQGLVSVEVRQPDSGRWMMSRVFDRPRANATLVRLGRDLLLIGGQTAAPGELLASTEQFAVAGVQPRAEMGTARTRHAACVVDGGDGAEVFVYGGYTPQGATGSVESYTGDDQAGWTPRGEGPLLGDVSCVGGATTVELFGGREPAGAPSDRWQRIDGESGQIDRVGQLAVPRARPAVAPIGRVGDDDPAYLIVGGEDGGAERTLVELVYPARDARYAYVLPPGVGPRRGHQAVSHTWLARVVSPRAGEVLPIHWRDVVVVGGDDPSSAAPLDEVLIFGLEPEALDAAAIDPMD